jgi:hypothetical protein
MDYLCTELQRIGRRVMDRVVIDFFRIHVNYGRLMDRFLLQIGSWWSRRAIQRQVPRGHVCCKTTIPQRLSYNLQHEYNIIQKNQTNQN